MKYIFDFDDVLFNNTEQFKEHMFKLLGGAGVPEDEAREFYLTVRERDFSLKRFISTFLTKYDLGNNTIDSLYYNIMSGCNEFRNTELLGRIQSLGRENCYIVTNGNQEFQKDKLRYSGIGDLFDPDKIFIVLEKKAGKIKEICDSEPNEEFVFIDDKPKFTEEEKLKTIPNLQVLLWEPNNIGDLAEIGKLESTEVPSELKKKS